MHPEILATWTNSFDPTAVATAVLALATLVLAGMTYGMVRLTRSSLEQTREAIRVTQIEVEEARLPVVIPFVDHFNGHEPSLLERGGLAGSLMVAIMNVGAGAALRIDATIVVKATKDWLVAEEATHHPGGTVAGIAPGQMAWLYSGLEPTSAGLASFELTLTYEDVAKSEFITVAQWKQAERRFSDVATNAAKDGPYGLAKKDPPPLPESRREKLTTLFSAEKRAARKRAQRIDQQEGTGATTSE